MKTLQSIFLAFMLSVGNPCLLQASPGLLSNLGFHASSIFAPEIQSGIIAIEDDIYMIVNTQAFAVTVKAVKLYTDASKSNFVMGLEGCANPYCSYNLVTAGLAAGTYFVEVETYSSTFFSNWVTYE